MPTAKDLIEAAAKAAPSPKMPSDAAAALARTLSAGSLDPKQGLRIPEIIKKASK